MKQVQDLLRGLLTSLDEASTEIEDGVNFDLKHNVLTAVDSAYNEISYMLSELC
jgi:hypothetical protein